MRILVVSPYLPHDRIGHGGGQAIRSLLRALSARHHCLLVSLLRPGEENLLSTVQQLGCELATVPFLDQRARGLDRVRLGSRRLRALVRSLQDGYPYYVAKYASRALSCATIAAVRSFRPDIVQIEYLQLAYLVRDLRRWRDSQPPSGNGNEIAVRAPHLILDSHEIASLPRRRRAAGARGLKRRSLLLEAASWDRLARDASAWADCTLCVTDQDRSLLAAVGGQRLVTVPLGIDTYGEPPRRRTENPPRILFLGSFQHPPNRSAAIALCDRIWPRIHARLPNWELVLAGPGSDAFLASRPQAGPRIVATGYVEDLAALFSSCRLFAAPLTEGGGIKIKILEAMARGLPVVTTSIGAEGIVTSADDLVWLVRDDAQFAAQLLSAAQDPEAAERRAELARLYVERHFSWNAIVGRLEQIYRTATGTSGRWAEQTRHDQI